MLGTWGNCSRADSPDRWHPARSVGPVLWLSVCAGVAFLVGGAGAVSVPPRAGRGKDGDAGETSGEPWGTGKGATVVSPALKGNC
jgi:hypothetical protein